MIIELSTGKYLHTAYSITNIPEEMTTLDNEWSLTSQDGMDYIGTFIDGSSTESTDPNDYAWEELIDEDLDDIDEDGDVPVDDFQTQIDELQDQVTVNQDNIRSINASIENVQTNVASNSELSSATADIANATNQHFWTDGNGVHVSNEEANAEGDRNTLFNSIGMIFRKGANYLTAILAGGASGTDPKGLAVYDGQGNSDENVVASFTDSGSVIGKQDGARTVIQKDNISMIDENGSVNLVIESSGIEANVPYRNWLSSKFPLGINAENSVNIFNDFPKPSNGTVIDLEIEKSSSNPIILSFVVGTSSTETASDDGSTCSVSFDGDKILTFIPSSGSVWYPEWVTWTASEIAPCYTFGSRATTDDNDNPITTHGEFSMTVGTGLTSTVRGGGGLVIGRHNTIEHANDYFVIGNGSGKAARNDAFRVGSYGVYISGNLTASNITANNHVVGIVETGTTSNSWDYRLWSDGTYEAWRSHGFTGMALTSSSAGTYYGNGTTLGVPIFPNNGNTGVLQCLCSANGAFSHSSGVYLYQVLHSSATTATADMTFQFRAHASTSNAACGLDIYLKGTYS